MFACAKRRQVVSCRRARSDSDMDPRTRLRSHQTLGGTMFILRRLTARLAVVASFAGLLAAACNTDSKNVSGLSGPTLSADRHDGEDGEGKSGKSSKGVSSGF